MNFDRQGYAVVDSVLSDQQCEALIAVLPSLECAGSRALLSVEAFRNLVGMLRANEKLSRYLAGLVAVECILFRKSSEHNWAVTLHRDTVLPVQGRGAWRIAGIKEGMECAKPPRAFMDQCVAVRLQLDGAPVEDISLVPGSHLDNHKYDRGEAVPIPVCKGGALVLRPTLAHASSKLQNSGHRRVLHYVFGPRALPNGYDWYAAV